MPADPPRLPPRVPPGAPPIGAPAPAATPRANEPPLAPETPESPVIGTESFDASAPPHSALPPSGPDLPPSHASELYELRPDVRGVIDGTASLDRTWTADDVHALFAEVRSRSLDVVAFFEDRLFPTLSSESLTPGALCQVAAHVGLQDVGSTERRNEVLRKLQSLSNPDVASIRQASASEVAFAFDVVYDGDFETNRHTVPEPPLDLSVASLARWLARPEVLDAPPRRVFDRLEEHVRGRLTREGILDLAFRLGALVSELPDRELEQFRTLLIRGHAASIADRRKPRYPDLAVAFDQGCVSGRGALSKLPDAAPPRASGARTPRDLSSIRAHFEANGLRYLTEHLLTSERASELEALRAHDAAHWDRDDPVETFLVLCSGMGRTLEVLSEAAAQRHVRSQLAAGLTSQVSIRYVSEAVGHGLFVEEDLPAATVVGEYLGEVRRIPAGDPERVRNRYLFATPDLLPTPDGLAAMRVGLSIDAERAGNETRFLNHDADDPNLESVFVCRRGIWTAAFITRRQVFAGEELRYDYGKGYWRGQRPPPSSR